MYCELYLNKAVLQFFKKQPLKKWEGWHFPGGAVVKNLPDNAGDTSSIPGLEDSTCRRATKPMRHNYWACALELACHNYWTHVPQLLSLHATATEARVPRAHAPQQEKPLQWEARALQRRVAPACRN